MLNPQSPDVYIDEKSTGTRPIEAVGTSTAAFIGKAPMTQAHPNESRGISNWRQFLSEFVGDGQSSTPLVQGVWGYFQNGGGRCYVVNVGGEQTIAKALQALESEDEVTIVAAPGYTDSGSYDMILTHCENQQDRVAILDGPKRVDQLSQLVGMAEISVTRGDDEAEETGSDPQPNVGPRRSERGFGAFYYPWITIKDPLDPSRPVEVAPSGHVAGIYARNDAKRGVHKAPANEIIRGALGVTHRLTRVDQAELNPAGVNCIRFFSAQGVLVWGARSLATDAQWRYVNVRRLFNMIEESIARSTRWVVFEPNDPTLWQAIKRDVGAFLTLLWRNGALFGRTAEESFFVKCDEETNPPEVIDAGRVVIQIGIAPVKPAEFIIFEIGQHSGGTEVTV
jgi:phage tail sheath protein FI